MSIQREMVLTAYALLLILLHVAIGISCPEPLAAMAFVDVPLLFLCRYLLLRGASVFSAVEGRLRFRLKAAVAILYMALSALFFLRFAPLMPWWSVLVAWVMMVLIVEFMYAFFFHYSCCNELDGDVENPVVG